MVRLGTATMFVLATSVGCGDSGGTGGSGGETSSSTSSTSTSTTASSSSGTGGATGAPFTSEGSSIFESQTSIARAPDGSIVVAWIAFYASDSAIGYAVSRDGGATFTPPKTIHSPGTNLASNPVVVADSQNRFTLAWLGFGLTVGSPNEHVYVSRLDSMTETFATPGIASDDGTSDKLDFDKPGLAVGPSDELLVTYADFSATSMGGPAALMFARSTDGSQFTRSMIANDATFGNLASLCLDRSLGAQAPLYLVHLGVGATITLRVSTNQGTDWQLYPTPAASVVFQDPTCVVSGTDLYLAYGTGTAVFSPTYDSPADAVVVAHSANGGQAFDAPAVASDAAAGMQYLFPKIIRDASGKLELVYYEGAVGMPASFMLATSMNGTAWESTLVAPAGTFSVDRTLANWLGDYVGFAPGATTSFTSYADNAKGKAHVKFAEIAAP